MDYEKKYNEAMLRADEAVQKGCLGKDMFDIIFPPEESEDERIRKEIISALKFANDDGVYDKHLAWLEEQKDKNCLACDQHLKGYIAGRKVTEEEMQKESLHIPESCKENADSLTSPNTIYTEMGEVFATQKQKEQKEELVYRLNGLMQEYINESKDEVEQEHRFKCYKLFWDALEDTSYFDEQKEPENTSASTMIPSCWVKDPDKCPEFCVRSHCLGCPNYEQKEQKPELVQQPPITYTYNSNARRDERLKAALLALLNSDLIKVKEGGYFTKQDLIEWVERIPTDTSVEWNEEDTEMYINVASSLRGYACGLENEEHKKHIKKGLDWLEHRFKSLRPQKKEELPKWKPSDEQMNLKNL